MASPAFSSQTNGILILWGSIDPTTVDQDALNDWWTNEHLPERVCLPGFQRARRYLALEPKLGQHDYLAWYETSGVQDLASSEYLYALNHPTRRTVQFMPCLANMSRFACERIWSRSSPFSMSDQATEANNLLLMLVLESNATDDPTRVIDDYLGREGRGALVRITHTQIAKVNTDVTRAGSASKSYESVLFDSSSGDNDKKPADTFVALFEFDCTTDGPPPELSLGSEWLTSLTTIIEIAGLHIQYINTYKLLVSLAKNQIGC